MPTDPSYNPNNHFLGHSEPLDAVAQLHDVGIPRQTILAWGDLVRECTDQGLAFGVEWFRQCPAYATEQMLLTLLMTTMHASEQVRAQ